MAMTIFTIDTTGAVTVEVKGVRGPACSLHIDEAAEILGPIATRQKTREHYLGAQHQRQQPRQAHQQ